MEKRFTAKWWEDKSVEQEKIQYILDCAYTAPIKNGKCNYEIFVVTDSPEGRDLKEWMYYQSTWCLNLQRQAEGEGLKRFNGQVLAPVLLIWVADHLPYIDRNTLENEFTRVRDDTIVSSTLALAAAQEQGLATGFCGTIDAIETAKRLGREGKIASISLGVGYASPDFIKARYVYDPEGNQIGFDYSNCHPLLKHETRKTKPSKEDMINYI